MKDIADAAGVAQSTVSRILNDAPVLIRVSDETRERVRAIATELGYQPHPFARALRGAPTMLLGAVVRDITDPFFAGAIEALALQAKAHGYSVVLGHALAAADEAVALTAVLEARQCDAIVLLGDLRDEPRLLEDLHSSHVPVVALWHGSEGPGLGFPTVSVDNRFGVRAALGHLTGLGHRRIAFLGPDVLGDIREREGAYHEFVTRARLGLGERYVRHVPNTVDGAGAALRELIALSEPPTAVFAATDIIAMSVIHAAFEHGVGVPAQLSVVGFDDIPFASATVPGLTTVRMPTEKIVAAGVRLAVGAVPDTIPRLVYKPKLVLRNSTSAPAPDR
jgi:DNA-binding LacI/PurR family transcriptional regulator